jgi:hypothetical protein
VQVAAGGTEVVSRGCCGVVDVEGIGQLVAAGVHAVARPGGRDELQRTDRAVIAGVPVESTVVGVADDLSAIAIELDADDAWGGQAAGQQHRAREAPMIGFDPADRGHEGPADPATGRERGLSTFGVTVGRQRDARDAIDGHAR